MPSDNEIKQIMTEKIFPFFEGNGLKAILSRLEAVEELTVQKKEEERIRIEAINKHLEAEAKAEEDKNRITEKEVRLIAEEIAARIVKKQLETVKKGVDKEMTVKIDESGRPQVVEKGSKKK